VRALFFSKPFVKDILEALQSIGLAAVVTEVPFFTDEPKYPSYFHGRPESSPYRKGEPYGLSLAADALSARIAALAEFYERLCLYNAPHDGELRAWDVTAGWVDPVMLVPAAGSEEAAQLRATPFVWLDATDLISHETTKIPAAAVIPGFEAEPSLIAECVSTSGAAFGVRHAGDARIRGLFEVVERHAGASTSTEQRLAERIVGLPADLQPILETLHRFRLEPFVFRLPAKWDVPGVLVALADRSGVAPALSIAMRAAPTFVAAVQIGLFEALERRRPARVEEAGREPGSNAPRIYPWESLDTLRELEPMFRAATEVPWATLPEAPVQQVDLLGRVAADGFRVLCVELTLPEVRAAGFEAVKIVLPGLRPMPA
jgi:ribosomal protein S12 methylthiotransferase accessory factor YcaO